MSNGPVRHPDTIRTALMVCGVSQRKSTVWGMPSRALHQRLLFSLSFEQDPWQEQLSKPQLKKEFDRIAVKQLENA